MNNPRPTPETDAEESKHGDGNAMHAHCHDSSHLSCDFADFARKLERERDELREQYESQLTALKATLQAVDVEGKISWETFKLINNALTKL